MEQTYGRDVIDRLVRESNQTVKYKAWDYDEIAEKYRKKTEDLIQSVS